MNDKLLQVSGSPHIHSGESVKKIMWSVVLALLPAFLVSIFYFGLPVIILTFVSIASCIVFEYLIQKYMLRGETTIWDGSAVITGMLLAFNLPSNLPLWMVVVGALIAIGVGKMAFGGLGKNLFNPALVARVFLLISFPVQMTSWPIPKPIFKLGADVVSGPTPLGILKEGVKSGQSVESIMLSSDMPGYVDMLLGQMGGSFGEISAIALLIGAIFLLIRKVITWHIPVSFLLTIFLFSGIFYLVDPSYYAIIFSSFNRRCFAWALFMRPIWLPLRLLRAACLFSTRVGVITLSFDIRAYPEGFFCNSDYESLGTLTIKGFKPRIFGKIKQ